MKSRVHYQKLNKDNIKHLRKRVKTLDRKSIVSRYGQLLNPTQIIESCEASQLTFLVYSGKYLAGYGQVFRLKNQKYPEIGYMIFPRFRNKGLGFMLTKRIMNYCLKHNIKLKGEANIPNKASIGLLRKISKLYTPVKAFRNTKYEPNTFVWYWNFGS